MEVPEKVSITVTQAESEDAKAPAPVGPVSPGGAGAGPGPLSPSRSASPVASGPMLPGILQPGAVDRGSSSPVPLSPASHRSEIEKMLEEPPEEDETKKDVKTLFVQCFKDDLFQERQLLMSQINNLFKLRNNGEALQYKERGSGVVGASGWVAHNSTP